MRLDVVLRVAAKLLLPFMLAFALYVQFHGDYGPGGGFQAGVIAAAGFILYGLIYGLQPLMRLIPQRLIEALIPFGVFLYAGVGVVGMLQGNNYLDYSALDPSGHHGQEWGVFLVEAGVFFTVSSTMLAIFYAFAGRARS